MKHKLQIIVSASAASLLALSALAQDPPNPKTDRSDYSRQQALPRLDRLNGAAKASEIIGMTVKNYQGEKLGKVDELAVDVESGRLVQVILSTGGFIGVGDTLTAVPPGALHHDVAQKVLHLDADKEKLKTGPKFELSKWGEYSDSEHLSQVYRHYGQESNYRFVQRSDGTEGSPNTVSKRKADGTWDKDRLSSDSQFMIPASRLSQLQKASKLMGTPVKNLQDEKVGKVENLLLDLGAGRVVAVVISSGGFLGMGDELSAVPPSAFRHTADRDALQLDASKEMLSSAPHFKANQWPDFDQPTYVGRVYEAYKVEPYWTTEADNTARNVRDRDDRTLTPLDQSNSKADVNTTAQIRKKIIADKTMSVNARNVKIITSNGQVTLRGPVNTAEEKRRIGEIASRFAPGNVDNQLEVKFSSTSND